MKNVTFLSLYAGQRLRSVNTVLLDQPTCEAQIRALAPREAVLPADLVCTLNPPAAPADGCVVSS